MPREMSPNDERSSRWEPSPVECPLCQAVQGKPHSQNGIDVNRVLFNAGSFIIIPALGPLVTGHALAITKKHSLGLTYLDSVICADYDQLALRLRQYCHERGDDLLEIEHGSSSFDSRGPCIQHTHVHLLPGLAIHIDTLADRLPPLELKHKYTHDPRVPYIWLRSNTAERRYNASNAMGQEIRQALGNSLELDDYDWASNPRWSLVATTLFYWEMICHTRD